MLLLFIFYRYFSWLGKCGVWSSGAVNGSFLFLENLMPRAGERVDSNMGFFSLLLRCFDHPVMSKSSVLSVLIVLLGQDCSGRRIGDVTTPGSLHIGRTLPTASWIFLWVLT